VHRLLFIAYHFPPSGGAGAQRSVKFVKYLPELGWAPVVVTAPESAGDRWTPIDDSLDRELQGRAEVVRLAHPQPPAPGRARARAERIMRLRRSFTSWWVDGVVRAGGSVEGVEAILATGSPFDSFEAASRLAAIKRVPWIADLRDPWALDEMTLYPSSLHRSLERRRMRRVLRTAAAIVMNTTEATRMLVRSFPELRSRPIETIPNGFDAEDFGGPTPEGDRTRFRIVHTGYLHTELASRASRRRRRLGGATPGLEIGTRSHVFLLDAVERIHGSTPFPIELVLAGVTASSDRAVAEGRPFHVSMPGYVDHDRSVALVRSADVLFLPMHDLPEGRRATIVPGKTYEYLASGRPILAAVPDGDARDLLARADAVTLCRPDDVACMADALTAMIEGWEVTGTGTVDRSGLLAPYERRVLTAALARVLDSVAG
jgi:glycosyltransferase involved in cell wall biosynthesis